MIPTRKRRFPSHNRRQAYPVASTTDHVGRVYGRFEARKSPQGHWLVDLARSCRSPASAVMEAA